MTRRLVPGPFASDLGLDKASLPTTPAATSFDPPPPFTPSTPSKIEGLENLSDLDHKQQEDYLDHHENMARTSGDSRQTDFLFITVCVFITSVWAVGAYLWLHRPH